MLSFNRDRVLANVRKSKTDDLLDRVTVYREGMEPQALNIIESELESRGVTREQIQDYARQRAEEVVRLPDGVAAKCSFCRRPAVAEGWGWQYLWGRVPVFPRFFRYCEKHRPA